jgi:hypothetical protein
MTAEPEMVSLKEFFESKIDALQIQTNLRFDALDKALHLAQEDRVIKDQHLNNLRQEVTTDRQMLVMKEQCIGIHKDLGKWMDGINTKITTLETRSITWTAAVGIFFLILNLVAKWITL